MHIFIVLISMVLLISTSQDAAAFDPKGQDCSKCHRITKKEAETLLKKFSPDVRIIEVKRSEAKYLWEVSFESKGRKQIVYLDLPKKHFIAGSVINVATKQNLTENSISRLKKVNVSQIPLKNSLILGNRNAKYKIFVFDDPE